MFKTPAAFFPGGNGGNSKLLGLWQVAPSALVPEVFRSLCSLVTTRPGCHFFLRGFLKAEGKYQQMNFLERQNDVYLAGV